MERLTSNRSDRGCSDEQNDSDDAEPDQPLHGEPDDGICSARPALHGVGDKCAECGRWERGEDRSADQQYQHDRVAVTTRLAEVGPVIGGDRADGTEPCARDVPWACWCARCLCEG
jgi:hypothetical protein